jgi:hypothetical protein
VLALKDHYQTFSVSFGASRTGGTVQYRIIDYAGTVVVDWTATSVYELGFGMYGVRVQLTSLFSGYIQWKFDPTGLALIASEEIVVEDDWPTVAEFEARTIPAANYFDPAADVVAHVTLVDTCTINTDMRGTNSAALAVDLADVPTVAEFEARTLPAADYVVTSDTISGVTAAGSVTGAVGSVTAPVTVGTNSDKTGYSLATPPPSAADIKTAIEADGSKIDHLWETTEDDGGVRRFTANALEEAPTGGTAPTTDQIAAKILKTPANLLDTDAAGKVTYNNTAPPTADDIRAALEVSGSKLDTIFRVETGRWAIIGNQMIFYAADGTTPLLTFDLKDIAGDPTDQNVYERVPV